MIGGFLAQVAADGVQIFLETHSDHVLNGIRVAVANGRAAFSPDQTVVHFSVLKTMRAQSFGRWNSIKRDSCPLGPRVLRSSAGRSCSLGFGATAHDVTTRFVLDESSWTEAAGADSDVLSNAVHRLLERLDIARERDEGVARHGHYYETDLGGSVQLYSALFETDCPLRFDRDLTERLYLALDRVMEFDDAALVDYEAEFGGSVRFSPGVAWAHASCLERRYVAVLPLPLGGVPRGGVPVTVEDVTSEVVFVTEESEHLDFFRSVIELERADEATFARLAPSAFPALEWADNVWRGLRDFSRPYLNVRGELVRYLGGLNDHGAACFHEHGAGDPRDLSTILSIRVGTETSDENGDTKSHPPSRKDRTRPYRGVDRVFWWHVKLQPNIDRIYFLHDPPSAESPLPEQGRIVVGVFKDHCILP